MQAYDRYFFPRGSIARRAARRAIRVVRRISPGLAERLAPWRRVLMRRLYDGQEGQAAAAEAIVAAEAGRTAGGPHAASGSAGGPAPIAPWEPAALRVVHVIGSLQAGGAERQVTYTLAGLRANGFVRAELLVTEGLEGALGHYRAAVERDGVPVSVAGARMDPSFKSKLAARPELNDRIRRVPPSLRPRVTDLAGELLVREPHIVHCWLDHTNLWGGVAAAIVGVPIIILSTRNVSPVHMPHLREPWFEEWYRALAAHPGVHFVNNSRAGAVDYANWLGLDPGRFRVILNGVDFSHVAPDLDERRRFRDELGVPREARLLTGVFRMADEKQPHVFVRVAERVLDQISDAHAVLVGTGRLEGEIRRLMRQSRHGGRMHHLGRRGDVPAILAESHVFLLTSKAEGTPNVLLEAQHLGCPPVTTAAGGAGDAIEDGVTGFVHPIGDEAGLAGSVLRLFNDLSLRTQFAAAGPKWVAAHFGLQRMIDETIELYRDALSERP